MSINILATLGPSTFSKQKIAEIINAGATTLRFNFSHMTPEKSEEIFEILSELDPEGKIEKLADLSGPKIRLGNFDEEGIKVNQGEKITITTDKENTDKEKIPLLYPEIEKLIKAGEKIYIEDGLIQATVISIEGNDITCEMITSSTIKPRKGVNLPDTELSINALTEKDKKDLEYICTKDFNYISLSFVNTKQDIQDLLDEIKKYKEEHNYNIIAKIERQQAIDNIESITEISQGIMIARGDLGIEVPFETVPHKEIMCINEAKKQGKKTIHATQVLASMEENPRPTRAEVTDIYFAVQNNVDYIMLSGETASGKYPKESVEAMKKTIEYNQDKV